MTRKVVITGVGVLSPYGLGLDALTQGLLAGPAVTPLADPFDLLLPGYGGQVPVKWKELRDLPGAGSMRPSTMTRYTFLAVGAVGDALRDAGIDPVQDGPGRGLHVGSLCNIDPMDKYIRLAALMVEPEDLAAHRFLPRDQRVELGMKQFTGFEMLRLMNNMPTAHTSIEAGAQGPCNTFLGSSVSGLHALGRAVRVVQDGGADVMLAGGVGSSVHEFLLMVKGHRGQLSSPDAEPSAASRPFDQNATGQVPGEAGVFFVVEDEAHARAREAKLYARFMGYGDAFDAPTVLHGAPPASSAVRASQLALDEASWQGSDIDLLALGGLSRSDLDTAEAQSLSQVLGDHRPLWVAPSAQVGFTESASGPLGLASILGGLAAGSLPGNPNTQAPIDELPLDPRTDALVVSPGPILVHGLASSGHAAALAVDPF